MRLLSKRNWLLSGVLATSLIGLTACGTAEKTATKNGEEKKYHLSVGYLKANGAPLVDIAIQEGYFEKENLEVELVPFNASTDGINALQANKIDIGLTFGTSTPLAFISQGADLDIIGGYMEGGHPIYVPEKDKDQYKNFADYKGKTIGTVRLSVPDIVYRSALKKAGLDLEKDVNIVEFKTMANLIEAAGSGKVDVAFASTGFLTKAQAAGLAPVAWSNDVQPGHVCCRVVSRGDISKEDAEAYKKFVKGIIQAERVKLETPEKAVEVSKERLKVDEKTVNEIVNEKHLVNSADPNKKQVVKMWEQMKDLGYVQDEKGVDINKHFNLTFYEDALNELIKEHPEDEYYQKTLERYQKQNL
ncbi:ABC transporter substrate-binding protein [Neobacillus sp. LXY-4]|uniref:ABC transporter substrate-binding protein n=1 Tax=Neobacillus sp. LXY-4 TaxID=3379826 RepID=UPI003EE246D5